MIRKLSVLFGVLFLSLWLSSTTSARDVRVTRTERICSTHPRPGYCDGPPGADEPTTTESVPEVPAVPLQLQLSDQPGAPQVGDVEIAIEDGATSATRTLFLSATNASDEAASAEIVNVFADIEGVTVEVVTKPETELASTLENGSFVVVTVKASVDATQADQVADERTWSGHLFADADGILTRLAPLQVDFSPAASVRVIGAADGKLQLGTQTPAFEGTVEIEVGPRDIEDLTVSFDALRSPGNRTVELTPDPSAPDLSTPQKVTARQRIKLPLTAELAEVGNYVGSMSVFAGSHVLATVDVTITRTRGAPDVDVEATVRTRHLSTGQRVDFLRGDKFATFSIEVENLTGAPLELAKPSLVNLARADGENLESESNDDHIRVYLQDPQDPDKRTLVGGAVEIPGDAISTFVFTVEGVDRAGTYTGTVKVRQVGGDSKDSVITILTRRPRWWLGGLVLVGTLVSLLTKWWVRNQRTKLAAQGQLLLLKTEFLRMRGDLKIDGAVNSVIARLQADLVTLGQISGDDPAKITAESVVFNQRLIVTPQWARLHYRLTSLDAEVHPVPNLADIRRQADEIRDRLKDHSTPLDSLKNDLSTLLPSLNRQLDDALLTRVGSLIDHLGELVVRDADPSTSVELTTAGRMEIERAKAELANAKKSLDIFFVVSMIDN